MSLDALSWAFNLELPNSGAKLTLLALANFADEHGEAYPSQQAISIKTCLSERAIRGHLVTLEQLGIISRVARKRANGSYTSDRFKIFIGGEFTGGKFCQRQNLPEANSASLASGKICRRQKLPTAKNDRSQRQNLPDHNQSLNTTVNTLLHTEEVNRTTEREETKPENRVCVDWIFPSVPEQTRSALERIIANCNPADGQAILDEISGTLAKGACKNPITLAMSLVKALAQGKFYPALGVDVAQNRAKSEEQARMVTATQKPEDLDPQACLRGQEIISTIRTRRQKNETSMDEGTKTRGFSPSG